MNEPKFKVGDRVQTTSGVIVGRVTKVEQKYVYSLLDDESGGEYERSEEYLERNQLSEQDAWIEASLKIGLLVNDYGTPLYDSWRCEIRHQVYKILGGDGITITDEVKAKVRALIERAVAQHDA